MEEAVAAYRVMLDRVVEIEQQASQIRNGPGVQADPGRLQRIEVERAELVAGIREIVEERKGFEATGSRGMDATDVPVP